MPFDMKKNKGVLLIIVLALVAGGLYWYKQGLRPDRVDFHVENIAALTEIKISDKKPSMVLLEKQDNGRWLVNKEHLARKGAVETLLNTMRDMRVKAPVPKTMHPKVLGDMATYGKKVELRFADGSSKVFFVGTETRNHLGTYMMMDGASQPYALHIPGFNGFLNSRFFTEEADWRSQEIVAWDNLDIKQVSLQYPSAPEQSFTLLQPEPGQVEFIADGMGAKQELDTTEALKYLALFRNLNYESDITDVMDVQRKDSVLNTPPAFEMYLENRAGEKVTLTGYHRPNLKGVLDENGRPYPRDIERLYGVTPSEDWVLLQYFSFEPVLAPAERFIVNK